MSKYQWNGWVIWSIFNFLRNHHFFSKMADPFCTTLYLLLYPWADHIDLLHEIPGNRKRTHRAHITTIQAFGTLGSIPYMHNPASMAKKRPQVLPGMAQKPNNIKFSVYLTHIHMQIIKHRIFYQRILIMTQKQICDVVIHCFHKPNITGIYSFIRERTWSHKIIFNLLYK